MDNTIWMVGSSIGVDKKRISRIRVETTMACTDDYVKCIDGFEHQLVQCGNYEATMKVIATISADGLLLQPSIWLHLVQ